MSRFRVLDLRHYILLFTLFTFSYLYFQISAALAHQQNVTKQIFGVTIKII